MDEPSCAAVEPAASRNWRSLDYLGGFVVLEVAAVDLVELVASPAQVIRRQPGGYKCLGEIGADVVIGVDDGDTRVPRIGVDRLDALHRLCRLADSLERTVRADLDRYWPRAQLPGELLHWAAGD